MPVLPPIAASTIPSTVVGMVTNFTPRNQVAATKPARSVVAPPPSPTTASDRVKPAVPSTDQHRAATAAVLAASASGTSIRSGSNPGPPQLGDQPLGDLDQPRWVQDRHPLHAVPQDVR